MKLFISERKLLMSVHYCLQNKLLTSTFWVVNIPLFKALTVKGYFKPIISLIDKALA